MTSPIDPITDSDLQAYIDEQLAVPRRIEVEAWLSRQPAAAAQVMADLQARDELRLALAEPSGATHPGTWIAARRLERGLVRDRLFRRARRIAAVAAVLAVGWVAHAEFGALTIGGVVAATPTPAYVDAAVRAHETVLLRAGMQSQPGVAAYDPDEIRAATAIVLPALPPGWKVVDVQVFPSAFGPSVELAVSTGDFGLLSLFAVRPGAFAVVPATVLRLDEVAAAYWQLGEVAYALVGKADAQALDRVANGLAKSLY